MCPRIRRFAISCCCNLWTSQVSLSPCSHMSRVMEFLTCKQKFLCRWCFGILTRCTVCRDTQNVLRQNRNTRLHKIRSKSIDVPSSFPRRDVSEDVLCVVFTDLVRSLGLSGDIKHDAFTFSCILTKNHLQGAGSFAR